MIKLSKIVFAFLLLAALAPFGARAEEADNNRLLIVNGNSGRVIYDDGRDDLFCVTRRHIVGYDDYGRRIYHRSMRCR